MFRTLTYRTSFASAKRMSEKGNYLYWAPTICQVLCVWTYLTFRSLILKFEISHSDLSFLKHNLSFWNLKTETRTDCTVSQGHTDTHVSGGCHKASTVGYPSWFVHWKVQTKEAIMLCVLEDCFITENLGREENSREFCLTSNAIHFQG